MTTFVVHYHVTEDTGRHQDPNEKPMIVPVAYVKTDRLENVFRMTNSVDRGWANGRDEGVLVGLRSSCVGDVIKDNETGDMWRIDDFGFSKVEPDDYVIMRFAIELPKL